MTNKQFLESIADTYAEGIALIEVKNADYASSTNPFKNFESAAVAGVDVKRAILIRVLDKISRISNLLDKEAKVKDETIDDTLVDAINYLAILKANIEGERTK
jgi:hypothetical protein